MVISWKSSGSAEVAVAADNESVTWVNGGHKKLQLLRVELSRACGAFEREALRQQRRREEKPFSCKDGDVRAFKEMKRDMTGKLDCSGLTQKMRSSSKRTRVIGLSGLCLRKSKCGVAGL